MKYTRKLHLPPETLFLWGPRQTGKTTLLKDSYTDSHRIDLLKTDEFIKYKNTPSLLREELALINKDQIVVIDEIQKVPQLLDEVHYLIQEQNRTFILCGSSARKVRKGHANLLGGRALRYELLGLSSVEIGEAFSLLDALNSGTLPNHYGSQNATQRIRAYVETYLKEEILAEGLTRKLPTFTDFLRVAAISDTEVINFSNIARECGVAGNTVRDYFSILEDTLIGAFLPAYTRKAKRRVVHAPKFYFRDVGVVNHLARRGHIQKGSMVFGKAFENLIFHELSVHSRYTEQWYDISYWRLSSGIEVDFVLGDAEVAIEVKGKERIHKKDLKNLHHFKDEYPAVKKRIVVFPEGTSRHSDSGILILSMKDFIEWLWKGDVI